MGRVVVIGRLINNNVTLVTRFCSKSGPDSNLWKFCGKCGQNNTNTLLCSDVPNEWIQYCTRFISDSVQLTDRGDCVICLGTSFDSANYTGCLVGGGTPTEIQLLEASEVSAALPFIWAPPF